MPNLFIWTKSDKKSVKDIVIPHLPTDGMVRKYVPYANTLPPSLGEGDVILSMGASPLKELQKAGVLPKNRTLKKLREKPFKYGEGYILVTYDPGMRFSDPSVVDDIRWDTILAHRLVTTGGTTPQVGKYRWVPDYTETIEAIKSIAGDGKALVTIDLETTGLVSFSASTFIVSISITHSVGQADLIRFRGIEDQPAPCTPLHDQITWLLTSPSVKINGANLKYDFIWIKEKWGIDCTNYTFDTTLVGSMLNENRSNSLTNHSKLYCPELGGYDSALNATYDKGKMEEVPDDDLLIYAGGDTDACHRVALKMRDELLRDKELTRLFIEVVRPASQGFEWLERTGMLIDTEYYKALEKEVGEERQRLSKEAIALIPKVIQYKYTDNLSLTRSVIIRDYFFTASGLGLTPVMKTDKGDTPESHPSTALKHLKLMADKSPEASKFVELYKEYNSAGKTLSTYIKGFLKYLREDTRLHASYFLHKGANDSGTDGGTSTGRLSATEPGLQTLPKHTKWSKKLRTGYIAPPGYKVCSFDYEQGELKIAACLAREKTMLDAYSKGIDLHAVTAAKFTDMPLDEFLPLKETDPKRFKVARQRAKAGNFGLVYQMSAKGFRQYAADSYGAVMSDAEAKQARDNFFELYSNLIPWHNHAITTAQKQGFIRSPMGRIRHLPLINSRDSQTKALSERQAINSPVQGTLNELTLYSVGKFYSKYYGQDDCLPTLMVHDDLTFYIREGLEQEWAKRIADIMENVPLKELFGWDAQLQFTIDAEYGYNLGDMEPLIFR